MRIFVLILFLFVNVAQADNVTCEFRKEMSGYTCGMTSFISEKNVLLEGAIGRHDLGMNRSSVNVFLVQSISITPYLPKDICLYFTSLYKFDINAKKLIELSRRHFYQCTKVHSVYVIDTLITWLSENIFNDLSSLKILVMIDNKITFLPKNLFKTNQKLEIINFSRNKLAVINMIVPKSVKKLSLKRNPCIDKSSPEDFTKISSLVSSYRESCRNEMIERVITELKMSVSYLE